MAAEQEKEEASINTERLQRDAYEAVESATRWLADRRRTAEAEDYQPYSDKYTTLAAGEEESGFMSSAEGMTALFQVLSYIRSDDTNVYFTPQINEEILTFDIEWILERVEEGQFLATPYLPSDATSDFTDAVSFVSTTLQLAIESPRVNVEDSRLEQALCGIVDWFLDNYRESVDDSDAVGWAWCGSTQIDELEKKYPPQTYFTYSASVALTDLYSTDQIDYRKDEIGEILSGAIKCLLGDYWVEGRSEGWTEFTVGPYNQGLTPNEYSPQYDEALEDIFSTSNTLMATAYMWNNLPDDIWDNADLNDEEIDRIQTGIDYVLESVDRQLDAENLHNNAAEYTVEATVTEEGEERQVGYFDGTLPYTVMNALIEIEAADGPFEHRREDIEERKREVIDYILDICWDSNVGDIGFKHFDPTLENEPVVTYSTQVALESLLGFELQPPEEGVKIQVIKKIENTKSEIADLLEDTPSETNTETDSGISANESVVLTNGTEFTKSLLAAMSSMRHQYQQSYSEIDGSLSKNARNEAGSLADENLKSELEEVNIENFLRTLSECYFADSPEEFRSAMIYFKEEDWIFALDPQRNIIEDLLSYDDQALESFEKRANIVESVVNDVREDMFCDQQPAEVGNEFNQRTF